MSRDGLDDSIVKALDACLGLEDPALAGEVVVIFEVDRLDVDTGSVSTFRASTREFATSSTDSPAHTPYWARLVVPSFGQTIIKGGRWIRSSAFNFSEVMLLNTDGAIDHELSSNLEWKGRPARLLAGLRSWSRADFKPFPGGSMFIIDRLESDDNVRLVTSPVVNRPDLPVQQTFYGGFGGAYDFSSTANVAVGDVINLGERDFTVEMRFKCGSTSSSNRVLLMKRNGLTTGVGNPGYALFINSSDILRFWLDNGTTLQNLAIGSAGEFTDDEWHHVSITGDRSGDLAAYVDGTAAGTPIDISSFTGSVSNSLTFAHGSDSAATAGSKFHGVIDEPRVWYQALSAERIESTHKYSLGGAENGLVGIWRYDEYSGTTISCDVFGASLVQTVFDGVLTCSMGTTDANPGTKNFSVTLWMRCGSGVSGTLLSRKSASGAGNSGYAISVLSGTSVVFDCSDGTTLYSASVSVSCDDTPIGVGMTINRSSDELIGYVLDYARGTITASSAVDITGAGSFGPAGQAFTLGAYSGGSNVFAGNLSWVVYSPVAFTTDQVNISLSEQPVDLDRNAVSPHPSLEQFALESDSHFWPLREIVGTTASDQIGSATGTFTSAPARVSKHGILTTGLGSTWVSTLEGNDSIRGKPKPVAIGRLQRIVPVLVDPDLLIYQWSDPLLGECEEVEQVAVGGVPLTLTTDYTVDLTTNTLTLVSAPDDIVTADIKGVVSDGRWIKFPGECLGFIWKSLLQVPSSEIDQTSIDEYDVAHPYEIGLFMDSGSVNSISAVHNTILPPRGYTFRSTGNKLSLGFRFDLTDEIVFKTLSDEDIQSVDFLEVPPPAWMVRIGYNRTFRTQLIFDASADLAALQEIGTVFRYAEAREDAIRSDFADSLSFTYNTLHMRYKDASNLAEEVLGLDSARRQGWQIVLASGHWSLTIGDVIDVSGYGRYASILEGKKYLVVGVEYGIRGGSPFTSVSLWG